MMRAYFARLQAALPADGPGFSAVVVRDGQVVYELHHGLASLELGVPLSARSMYYLASESKQFTAAAVLALVRAWTAWRLPPARAMATATAITFCWRRWCSA